ncbi:MAG: 50S ribosomal protein L25/general stress protein Ctc [Pseudomonadota bacterium]
MEILELKSMTRAARGKGAAKTLRRSGNVPAVLYGRETQPVHLSISENQMEKAFRKVAARQAIFNLAVQNGETFNKTVMIKELQTHPVSNRILHIDFYEIDMNRKIRVKIPVVIRGKAKGIEQGGFIQIIQREVEVLCLPLRIPDSIEVDVTELKIGDSIHVKDIPLESDIEIPAEVNFTVVTLLSPKAEEVAKPEEAVEAGEEKEEAEAAEEEE